MNFLGLRSQSTAAQPLPPPTPPSQAHSQSQVVPQPINTRRLLEDLVAEDPFPLASLVHNDDGTQNAGPPVVDKHIDVSEQQGWITIPRSSLSLS